MHIVCLTFDFDGISGFIARGDLCFDVGANVGNRVKIFLKMRARVVAAEPQAACAAVLREKYGANANLTIVEVALGETAIARRTTLHGRQVSPLHIAPHRIWMHANGPGEMRGTEVVHNL